MQKVSVIMPCYNKGEYVEEAVKSVLEQTYGNIEIVIVNDGSSDNSSEVIKSLADKYKHILFFDEKENRGVVWARNFAVEASTGEFILPLDADDTIDSTFVEKAVKILEKNQKMIVSCRNVFDKDLSDEKGLIDDKKVVSGEEPICCSAMFRKSDFEEVGGYKECMNNIGCEDWELFLNFINHGYQFYKINEKLFNYRRNTNQNRSEIQAKNTYEIKRKVIELYPNLFLSEQNIDTLFTSPEYVYQLQKKRKKYKKLFNIMLIVAIVEFVVFTLLIFTKGQIW